MEDKQIYIVYGSQTGNAEYIAKDLSSKLNDLNISNKCSILNTIKKVDLRNSTKLLIIICSTTGNGDCPENADLWWRSIKVRSAAKDTFQDIPYHVLGLGDTNYDKFCYMGKSIDKRLNELGGKRFLELCCADEAVGLDEVIESWKIRILQYITNYTSSKETKLNDYVSTSAYSSEAKETFELIELKNSIDTYSIIQYKLTEGLFNIRKICEHLNLQNILVNPPEANLLPKRKNEPVNNLSLNLTVTEKLTVFHDDGWTQENPFTAEVTNAKWLTKENNVEDPESPVKWGDSKRVIHVDISISNSNIDYQPGDCIGICCPNPNFAIEIVYTRIKNYHNDENLTLDSIIYNSSSGEYLSLNDILTNRLDLTGPLRKGTVIQLIKYCRDIEDSNFISWLCSNTIIGKQLWNEFIESQALGLAELLELIPSCYPPLYILLSFQQLAPRFYSISSSPLAFPDTVSIAFSVERYCTSVTNSDIKLRRYGLCTTYLENLLQQYLNNTLSSSSSISPVYIRIFHKATINFKMPGSLAHPMILIGPGTGISPFIGFLQHREHSSRERMHSGDDISTGCWRGGFELNENDLPSECNHVGQYIQSVDVGPIYLFFGCRNSNDYLYKDELEHFHRLGVITKLEVAFSRITNEKVYVTNKIIESGKLLCDLIVNSGAYIYICGDGNHMAKSVLAAFKNILIDYNNMSDKEATDFIEELKHRRRYLLDIWS